MASFIDALLNPDIAFFRYAFIAGILSSVAFGVVGSYVVVRRISYIAGAIAHCVLGGIGAALYLQHQMGWTWLEPIYGAVLSALLAAIIIGLVSLHAQQREDTVIGALWAVGMATGLVLIAKTPGYIDPMSYLFGNILMISRTDLWLILILDAMIITSSIYFYNKFLGVCFDEEFVRLKGVRVDLYFLLLLCLTAMTIVLLVSIVGIVMVIAMLTLPAAVTSQFSRQLWQMMAGAVLLCMVLTSAGLGISYIHDLPSGPTIILLAGAAYLVAVLISRIKRSLRT